MISYLGSLVLISGIALTIGAPFQHHETVFQEPEVRHIIHEEPDVRHRIHEEPVEVLLLPNAVQNILR
ncbi:hypothetical protein JTE90_019621 [Oedothorax gibbosus]|uniref:Uncharacterized protein n=1 Tax=Oedothorax gibbosus TaxID=931172 RepID=A0AAV6TF71_9ARAC|nr:hypothetical protein JTE90_019621 [Oedothorax gibbosus]